VELSETHLKEIIEKRKEKEVITSGIEIGQVHAPINSWYIPSTSPIVERIIDLADFRKEIREREIEVVEKCIEVCHHLGISSIVVHPGGLKGWDSEEEYEKIKRINREVFTRLAEKGEKEKEGIAVENTAYINGKRSFGSVPEELLDLIEEINSDYLGICIDTSHANLVKEFKIPEFIEKAGRKIIATHISDNLGKNDDHLFPYSGKIEWGPILKSFRNIGYNKLFNLEIPGENRCPLEVRKIKLRYAFELLNYMKEVMENG